MLLFVLAITHKVKELNLILSNDAEDLYKLPKRLFSNPFFEKVNWVACRFDKVEVVRWDSLRELRIGSMEFRDDMARKIVSGGIDSFELEIEAPCVTVLELNGCFRMNIQLKNVMNCVSVKLDFHFKTLRMRSVTTYEQQRHMLLGMFGSLSTCQRCYVRDVCIEVMATWGMAYFPFSMASCECLTLHTPIQERYLAGIIRVLRSSFNLRTIIIHMAPPYFEFENFTICRFCFIPVVNDVYSVGGKFQLSMLSKDWGLHLKKIRVCGFEGMRSGQEVLFLRDLLLISANLEMMVIEWRSGHQNSIRDASDEFVAESLLNVRRLSKNASSSCIEERNLQNLDFSSRRHPFLRLSYVSPPATSSPNQGGILMDARVERPTTT
ncbi:hypothetical protein HAX54_030431 [Datura stramonium]|uniref:FBD domain-containing protein n=1 Tax=Datura stramonium TaxID=4076 RepID=A0ABS8SB44_DATST|nr:hypothetical protein [Datura stramonium]